MIAALLVAACAPSSEAPPVSTGAAARGQLLYERGQRADGSTVTARLVSGSAPSSAVPCASCHGLDGRGSREGGVEAPDIRPGALGQPRAVGARVRGAYTPASLRRAITEGLDPDGQALSPVMPRYAYGSEDLEDLGAWLRQRGEGAAAGVSETSVRVGVRVGPDEAALGAWIAGLLAASPPLYGRRLEGSLTDDADLLAVVAPSLSPADLVDLPPDLPVLGPGPEIPPHRPLFYVPATAPSPLAPPCPALRTAPDGVDAATAARGAASVALLVHALSQAGRALSRATLHAALERTQSLETGCVGRLDYGPGRPTPTQEAPR